MEHSTPLAGTAFLLAACLGISGCSGSELDFAPPMHAPKSTTSREAIPRIDTETPAEYQTATFALG